MQTPGKMTAVLGRWLAGIALLAGLGLNQVSLAATEVRIARNGQAALPVVVARDASDAVRQTAEELAHHLGRIIGQPVPVRTGDGATGIAVGTAKDFPSLNLQQKLDGEGLGRLQQYLLESHANGIQVIGATDQAVDFAAWDLLYRLGHRQYFPGPNWEVVPDDPNLSIAVNVVESPSFLTREIWYTWGIHDFNRDHYRQWLRRNRAIGFSLQDRHAFRRIHLRHQAVFEAHPEYLALVDGKRKFMGNGTKFCLSNPAVRQLIVDDRVTELENNPDDSINIDPSDFGNWCECENCAAMGSVSDQVVILANEVAEAVVARFGPDHYVGILAYNYHSPPPTVRVHPNVIVSVATMFLKGGYTTEELIDGWQRQNARIGVYEYYSRNSTTFDLPGRAPVTDLQFLARSIPAFHDRGVRFLRGQSTDTWGGYGLGYYVAKRLMWDHHEDVDTLVDDFLTRAFGSAREPMARFYSLLYSDRPVLLSEDLVGRMYRLLAEAAANTSDSHVLARIRDLALYTRYVDLYRQYDQAQGDDRLEALGQMLSHCYRARHAMMIHVRARWAAAFGARSGVTPPPEAQWQVPEGKNPWKPTSLYTPDEIMELISDGIARHQLIDFETRSFSRDLVPLPASVDTLPLSADQPHQLRGWSTMSFYTWIHNAPAQVNLQVTAGTLNQDRGPAHIHLIPAESPDDLAVDHAIVPEDGVARQVTLRATEPGLHRIEINSGSGGVHLVWEPGLILTFEMSGETSGIRYASQSLTAYFLVPRGTTRVAGYLDGQAVIQDAQGNELYTYNGKPGYFDLPVPEGQDGQVWRIHNYRGNPRLLTVPGYAAMDPRGLLVPTEVAQ